jgi:hypothetical protein
VQLTWAVCPLGIVCVLSHSSRDISQPMSVIYTKETTENVHVSFVQIANIPKLARSQYFGITISFGEIAFGHVHLASRVV